MRSPPFSPELLRFPFESKTLTFDASIHQPLKSPSFVDKQEGEREKEVTATAMEAAEAPPIREEDDGIRATDVGFPFWEARRRRFLPEDPFFSSGNIERELLAKHVALDLSEEERNQLHDMECMDDKLKSLEDFEDHYHARHTASCSICSTVYPTSRLLGIHVSEAHDSFFQAKIARGYAMYECLVEGCRMKFNSYKARQQHLVDKHKFPTSFEFYKKAHPSKHQRQKQQHKQTSYRKVTTSSDAQMFVECSGSKPEDQEKDQQCKQLGPGKENVKGMDVDARVEDLVSAVSRLNTSGYTPSSISFGHRHNRGFAFLPRSVHSKKKNTDVAGAR